MHPGLACVVIRDMLRDAFADYASFPLESHQIEVMPDNRPPPSCGDRFIAVYGDDWNPVTDDANTGLDYYLGVSCTLTIRSPKYPTWERGKSLYAKEYTGMGSVCLKIMTTVSQEVSFLTRIHALDEYVNEFYDETNDLYVGQVYEFPRWLGTDPSPVPAYADHFRATNEHLQDQGGESIMGYTMTVRFGKIRCSTIITN